MDNSSVQKKTQSKGETAQCNTVSAIIEKDLDVTDSEIKITALAVEHEATPLPRTRFGRQYLKDVNTDIGLFKSTEKTNEKTAKQTYDKGKQKELRYNWTLCNDDPKEQNSSIQFDVLAQLTNILVRITLYKLLHLSKATRDTLREVLADSEVFLAHFP